MLKRLSKRLVIDPSVLLAAGETEHPVSSACRRVLQEILEVCHQAIVTEEIRHEWEVRPRERGKRPALFSLTWRASMVARRKLSRITVESDTELRARLTQLGLAERDHVTIEEDLHLVEAALASDGIIVSRDDEVRDRLRRVCRRIGLLKRLIWVNLCADHEAVLAWLRNGARPERKLELGFEESEDS